MFPTTSASQPVSSDDDAAPAPDVFLDRAAEMGDDPPNLFPGLNALTAHVAIVDDQGAIIWVNESWRAFAAASVPPDTDLSEGVNYFEVCANAGTPEAVAIGDGLRAVLRGAQPLFEQEYAFHTSSGMRWFVTRVVRLRGSHPARVIVAHDDITARKLTEIQTVELAREHAARTEAERLQQRFAFLADASALLAGSLDYATTLARIPELVVPKIADWCSVYLVRGREQLTAVAYLHNDPEKNAALRPLVFDYPPDPAWERHPIALALRTGQPQLVSTIPDDWAESVATDDRHLSLLRILAPTSMLALPLRVRGQLLGIIILALAQPNRSYDATDLLFADELATRAALAIDNARLYTGTRRAYTIALTAAGQVARLQSVTAALSEARLPEQVADVVMRHALDAVEAIAGSVALVNEADGTLDIMLATGYPPNVVEQFRTVPLNAATPLAEAVRTAQPVWLASDRERAERYPELAAMFPGGQEQAWAAVPLVVEGRAIGAVGLSFAVSQRFNVDDQTFMVSIAGQCAQAMARAQLYAAAQQARVQAEAAQQQALRRERRAQALAQAGQALAEASLEMASALDTTVQLLAELIGDVATVRILSPDGVRLELVAAYHRDPDRRARLREQAGQGDPRADIGLSGQVLRTGQAVFLPSVTVDQLPDATRSRYEGYQQQYGVASLLLVPLRARGHTFGVLDLARDAGSDPYNEEDLAFLQEMASRAGLAVENARLYREAQEARQDADQRALRMQALAEAGHSFSEVLYDPSAALEHITRYISNLLGDLCVVRLLSDDGSGLTTVAMHHPDPEALQVLRALAPVRLSAQGNRLYGPAVTSGQSQLHLVTSMTEMQTISQQAFWPFYDRYGIHNVLVVPLRARGRVIGTLASFRPAEQPLFTEGEQSLLESLADRAALAVENARLYRDVQSQRRHLQTVLDQIPEFVMIGIPPDGLPTGINRAAKEFGRRLGLTAEVTWHTLNFFHVDGQPYPRADLALLRALRGETVVGVEAVIEGPNGTRVVILASAAPIFDDNGVITSAVLVFQDITERKTLEQLKDDFMSLAAHELRTPLTVLLGQSQLIARRFSQLQRYREEVYDLTGVDADRMEVSVQDILGGAQDMARLVDELLDLSRIETGRLELKPQPANLADLLRKVCERHRQLHPDCAFVIADSGAPIWGNWDAGRLEQVFTNLLENAAKYSQPGGQVTVRAVATATTVQVQVQDTGIGIPAGDLPHIFDRHFRAANVGRSSTGLGLGLYLTRQLVERHGGSIQAESAEGEGSTFTVTLPLDNTTP